MKVSNLTFNTHLPLFTAFQTVVIAVWLLPAVCHSAQLTCTTGQAEMCKAAGKAPGTTLAGLGFDVVTMKRTQSYVIDVSTWQQNNSCTLCKRGGYRGCLQLWRSGNP